MSIKIVRNLNFRRILKLRRINKNTKLINRRNELRYIITSYVLSSEIVKRKEKSRR